MAAAQTYLFLESSYHNMHFKEIVKFIEIWSTTVIKGEQNKMFLKAQLFHKTTFTSQVSNYIEIAAKTTVSD